MMNGQPPAALTMYAIRVTVIGAEIGRLPSRSHRTSARARKQRAEPTTRWLKEGLETKIDHDPVLAVELHGLVNPSSWMLPAILRDLYAAVWVGA
jgi:hypothetical protein